MQTEAVGLSAEPHAYLGLSLGLPELQGAQALITHSRGTDAETKAQQCKAVEGFAQGHRSLARGEQTGGYLTQATRSPEQPGLYSLQCFLLLVLQTGLNWIDEPVTFSLLQKMIFPSTQLFLNNFFQEVSSRFTLIDTDIKISWFLIAPPFITNKMLIYWDASGSLIVNELKWCHIKHGNQQYSWKMYLLGAMGKKF